MWTEERTIDYNSKDVPAFVTMDVVGFLCVVLNGAESYRSTDPFAGAIPLLDNDDYTSDNPFEKPCTEAKVSFIFFFVLKISPLITHALWCISNLYMILL